MGLIYMRISPSNGKYIGQTKYTEQERWIGHCQEAFNPKSKNYNSILNIAIRKYGKDNFSVKILENNIPEENLDEREIYWIKYYNTYYKNNNYGYNMTHGGQGVYNKGESGIPILQYNLKGKFIKEWPSVKVAAEYFKIHENNLYAVINHRKGYSYANYLWKQITDPITVEELVARYKKGQSNRKLATKIYCVETNTIYNSYAEASREIGILSRKTISKYAKLEIPEPKTNYHFKIIKE